MANQTIIKKDVHTILDSVDDLYICKSEKKIIEEDYDIDKDVDMRKFVVVEWLDRIVNSSHCYSVDRKKILEKLDKVVNL